MKKIDRDWLVFLMSMGIFVLYLIFSAMTEMGTKLPYPWRDRKVSQVEGNESEGESKTEPE